MSVSIREATAPFIVGGECLSTWYKVVGDLADQSAKRPLVVIHGGPGMIHDYLSPLAELASDRPVIFYDQIGNGRSSLVVDKPATFWTIDLMLDQLVHLMEHLNVTEDFDVIGHSWGAVLLSELLIRCAPAGLKRAVFSNPMCDMQKALAVRVEQMQAMPPWVLDTLKLGMHDTPECRRAFEAYTAVHFCRTSPIPPEVERAIDANFNNVHIWNAFMAGELGGWSVVDRLHQITVPSLIINGRFDASQDAVVVPFLWKMPNAKWVCLEETSHMPFWEERERYLQLVANFLNA